MTTTKKIYANGTAISVLLQGNENDYNPNFNPIEFDAFRNQTVIQCVRLCFFVRFS